MEKLTIQQLKNYLGTGTTFKLGTTERNLTALQSDSKYAFVTAWKGSREKQMVEIESLKPIMYRLSDLDKFIPELGFVPLKRLVNDNPDIDKTIEIDLKERKLKSISSFEVTAWIDYESGESRKEHIISFYPFGNQGMTPFKFIDQLCNWHFWIFDESYFDKGLIIDKLTYK